MVSSHYNLVVFTTENSHRIISTGKAIKNGQMGQLTQDNIKWDRKKVMVYTNGPEVNDMKDIGNKISNMEQEQFIIKNGYQRKQGYGKMEKE